MISLCFTLISNAYRFSLNPDIIQEKSIEFEDLKIQGQEINITTPENTTYTGPMSGYYPASYGFENENELDHWELNGTGSGSITINSEVTGHKNVVDIFKTNTDTGLYMIKTFDNQTSGTVEFWWAVSGYTYCRQYFSLYYLDDRIVHIRIYQDTKFQCFDGIDWHDLFITSANTWYHVSVTFNCNSDKYYISVHDEDGIFKGGDDGNGFPFASLCDTIDRMRFESGHYVSGWHHYIDAVGLSWEKNYNIGDNMYEGLLVSFDLGFTPDWLGYSLDEQTNKTILGTTTIVFPDEGKHNIQLFGNNSFGVRYKSDIVYFSIDTKAPKISINFPHQNDFFSKIAPDYDITIEELNKNSTWYTLDGGVTNISFTDLSNKINQTEWNNQLDGPITLRFYANDSFGMENYTEVTIIKETVVPEIIIHSPIDGEIFSESPPYYNISITESNLKLTWYTIDNGLTNITTTELTGYIDTSVWNAAPNGAINIKFYARDKAGNEGHAEKIVVKKESQDGGGPPIFGYNLLIVFGIISVTVIFFYKKINK